MKFNCETTSLRKQLFTISTIVIIVLADLFIPYQSYSQINLIPNNSFEDTVNCPVNISGQYGDQIYALNHWFPAGESPDYFNSCSVGQSSNPLTGCGFQVPRSGNGYIGLLTILRSNFIPNCREYIGVPLNQSLIIGTKYYFKFYISSAFGGIQNIFTFSNKIGIKFSTIKYESQQNPLFADNVSSGHVDSIVTDTTNWLPFQFSFIADSSYQYLYLGNFYDGLNTDSVSSPNATVSLGAYYFVDDLCLSTDSNFCETILTVKNYDEYPLIIYPNPATNQLFFKNIKRAQTVNIFDLLGQELLTYSIEKEESSIDISNLPAGDYFVRLKDSNFKSIIIKKL